MKMIQKFFGGWLALCLVLSMLPVQVFAEASIPAEVTNVNEDNLTPSNETIVAEDFSWSLENGTLYISGHGAMPEFVSSTDFNSIPWYQYNQQITNVIIEEGITSICWYAFRDCYSLASVSIPESVSYIGGYAFNFCHNLTSVTIPSNVTEINDSTFARCYNLSSVTLGNRVEYIGAYAFDSAAISELFLPASVKSIEYGAFVQCATLSTIKVAEGNTSFTVVDGVLFSKDMKELVLYPINTPRTEYTVPDGVVSIKGYAFSDCVNLIHVVLPDSLNVLGDSAFEDCENLTEIVVPYGVTRLYSVFCGCKSLKRVVLPNSLTTIALRAFSRCYSLESIDIPDSVTTIDIHAFQSSALRSITIPKLVTNFTIHAISDCPNLERIDVDAENQYYASIDGILYNKDKTILIRYPVQKSDTTFNIPEGVIQIEWSAFYKANHLVEVTIPNSVQRIGHSSFADCANLNKVIIGTGVYVIEDLAFMVCPSLKNVVFTGDAPTMAGESIFVNVSPTVYVPANNATWNAEVMQDYGGTITWVPHILDNQPPVIYDRSTVNMFRIYDPNSGEHFYTGSTEERDNLVAVGWNYEGVGFTFPLTTGKPVYRLYDPVYGEHLYTMDEEEKARLMAEGWHYEGIAFNSGFEDEVPQYRLHNPNETRGAYHFTASIEEMERLISLGWEYQGIGWYSCWK